MRASLFIIAAQEKECPKYLLLRQKTKIEMIFLNKKLTHKKFELFDFCAFVVIIYFHCFEMSKTLCVSQKSLLHAGSESRACSRVHALETKASKNTNKNN